MYFVDKFKNTLNFLKKKGKCLLIGKKQRQEKSIIKELQSTVYLYESILSKLPSNVYWKDVNSVYMGCNERLATVMGLTSRLAIKGKTDFDFNWGDETAAESFIAFDQKVMKTEQALSTEDVFTEASGKVVTVLTNKTPLKNSHGKIIGVLAISVDITERKKMEEDLLKAKEAAEIATHAKTEFLRNMEHQLRTPFSGVYSMVELLAESETNPDKKELLEITYRSAKEFLDLLNDIIEFSRNQAESTAILAKKFDLKHLVENVIAMEQAAATFKNLTLRYKYPDNIPLIWISDPTRIQRIVLNLLSNAIKFTAKGKVTISVKLAEKIDDKHYTIQLIVSDTGIGIPVDKQDFVYEKFYRVHPANQNKYTGAGLGLYIVKQLVGELEGEIDVVSVPKKGTTFTCTLPLMRPLLDNIIANDQ